MSAASHFYLQQAEGCDTPAAASPLANRRAVLLRSKAVWLALAAREIEVQNARADRDRARQVEIANER